MKVDACLALSLPYQWRMIDAWRISRPFLKTLLQVNKSSIRSTLTLCRDANLLPFAFYSIECISHRSSFHGRIVNVHATLLIRTNIFAIASAL